MNEINKTLYIPLYGKAEMSRRGMIIKDSKAEEIWGKVSIPLKGKAKSKWLMYYMSMRAKVFDEWATMHINHDKEAIVLHFGCGLDSRCLRVEGYKMWYDIDLDDVISERKAYYSESDAYHMLSADIRDSSFLQQFKGYQYVIVIMEGISMYVKNWDLEQLFKALEEVFPCGNILMDAYTLFGAKMSKHNPVNAVGVSETYGVDNPNLLVNNTDIKYICEHSMTPQNLIDELKGWDKAIFTAFFTGKIARKTYRLYEYAWSQNKKQ